MDGFLDVDVYPAATKRRIAATYTTMITLEQRVRTLSAKGKEEQQLGIHFKSLKYSLVVNDVTVAGVRWCGKRRIGGTVAHK